MFHYLSYAQLEQLQRGAWHHQHCSEPDCMEIKFFIPREWLSTATGMRTDALHILDLGRNKWCSDHPFCFLCDRWGLLTAHQKRPPTVLFSALTLSNQLCSHIGSSECG